MTELNYRRWTARQLARRVREYAGYVGCGCNQKGPEGECSSEDQCARDDFARLARELEKRVSGHSFSGRSPLRTDIRRALVPKKTAQSPTPNKTGRSE